ncbi:MAG: hypothetical protein PSV26_17350 [Polaromonas sp.]|uniref:hypothetical protein n=1 Tax=Polaromonas sp. TaxID=1869339 RepID=UPI00248766A0|nr:hypothetical protein [Polaromonas sp.]MDI1239252.1 hypothetical protein [Polaromonas sp.]
MITPRHEDENTGSVVPSWPLNDDVPQSAEQAVLSNPVSDGTPAPAGEGAGPAGVLGHYRAALAGQVARRPGQSALLALAAGALGAALLRSAVSRRRR